MEFCVGTSFINAVFPPITSSKPDANGVQSSSSTSMDGPIGNLTAYTRKHVLQVSTYQVCITSINQSNGQTTQND